MNLETIVLINKLSLDIKNNEVYLEFKKANEELENSDEVKILSYKKDMAILEYEDNLNHYGKNDEKTFMASRKMGEAIFNLKNHELVKKYNEKLNKLNEFLKEIDQELFGEIYD